MLNIVLLGCVCKYLAFPLAEKNSPIRKTAASMIKQSKWAFNFIEKCDLT